MENSGIKYLSPTASVFTTEVDKLIAMSLTGGTESSENNPFLQSLEQENTDDEQW